MMRRFLVAGSLLAGLGVLAGAFGAHALAAHVSPDRLDVYQTAVRYQMYHALALFAVAWIVSIVPGRLPRIAGYLFIAGTVLFSGSLYTLVFTGVAWWGAVTPLGGAAFIAGWALLATTAIRSRRS